MTYILRLVGSRGKSRRVYSVQNYANTTTLLTFYSLHMRMPCSCGGPEQADQ